ncbi:MAG: acyl-CoA carboxylase subunit epsilon [Actinomycetota bacterium]|nr:acyl-CoA carboxylase subunit epsilon [Actinomycetota bacterium]
MSAEPGPAALLRVVSGAATAEELAALIAVVAAASAATVEQPSGGGRSNWSAPERGVRSAHRHGPGGWRASALPR